MPYEIALSMPGAEKIPAVFDNIIKKVDDLTKKTEELGDAAGSVGTGRGGGRGVIRGRGGSNWTDPWERLDRLKLDRALASMEGQGDDDLRGLDYRIKQAEDAVAKADRRMKPKSQSELLMDALMTSRMGFSGGRMQLNPLVGRMAEAGLIDPSKMAGMLDKLGNASSLVPAIAKLALPAAAIVAAGVGVWKLTELGGQKIHTLGNALHVGGGTGAQTAQLSAIGNFIGLSADQAASRAVELGERLRSGGYGAAYMRSRGVIDQGALTVNKAANYLKAVEELRKIGSDREATRVARDLGLTEEMWIRRLSERTFRRLKNSVAPITDDELQAEANYQANKQIVGNWWDNGLRRGSRQNMDWMARFLDRQSTGWWNWIAVVAGYNAVAEGMNAARGVGNDPPGKKNSIQENTDAMRDLTRTMKDSAEMLGAGPRARGAIPGAMRGQVLNDAMENHAMMLGAFTVG